MERIWTRNGPRYFFVVFNCHLCSPPSRLVCSVRVGQVALEDLGISHRVKIRMALRLLGSKSFLQVFD